MSQSKRISLTTIRKLRKYISKKVKELENDAGIPSSLSKYRTVGYLAGKLHDVFKTERDLDIKKEIEALTAEIETIKQKMGLGNADQHRTEEN